MKLLILLLLLPFSLFPRCNAQGTDRNEMYSHLSIEEIRRSPSSKIEAVPKWDGPFKMPGTDTFLVKHNGDSIIMLTPKGDPNGDLFERITIHASKWRPKPSYGNLFFFIGTYKQKDLPGMYISIYATKDWSSLLHLHYTNPGNIASLLLFTRSAINPLQKHGITIDPNEEYNEPERGEIKIKN